MASTYTVNIGIEKPGTGDQSGTWGVTTNTNFDIIDQATNGVATVTLSSAGNSGSPNTLLISNGALSDGRNRFIEFNDGADLGATAYVQLDPNDAEKIVHIRNSLSGSRSLILFQGTYNASNDFEVPNGADVLVKFDGGGTGATVTDVNVNLTPTKVTTGDLDVDNININGNTISSTDTNGNITLTPNGTGEVNLLDNDKLTFGAGSDLQIFHDGSHSRIYDNGGGELKIMSNGTAVRIQKDNGENMILANTDGAVNIYHDGSAKLATTATGVDVTGTVTADGLTVDGNKVGISNAAPASVRSSDTIINMQDSFITVGSTNINLSHNVFHNGTNWVRSKTDSVGHLQVANNQLNFFNSTSDTAGTTVSFTKRMNINGGGDISFFADNGTTQGLYWDASTQRLGLGTTSPATALDLAGEINFSGLTSSFPSPSQPRLYRSGSSAGSYPFNNFGHLVIQARGDGSNRDIVFATGTAGANKTVVTSDGKFGIGTISPATQFHSLAASGTVQTRTSVTGSTASDVAEVAVSTGSRTYLMQSKGSSGNFVIRDSTGAADRVTLTAAGSVGIGTTSPSDTLHVSGTVKADYFRPASNQTDPDDGSAYIYQQSGVGWDFAALNLKFSTGTSGNRAERMRIDSSGNVGIGTSAPSTFLDIEGANARIDINETSTNSPQIQFQVNGTEKATISAGSGGTLQLSADGDQRFNVGGSERMRLDSSGRLGIGTSSPTSIVTLGGGLFEYRSGSQAMFRPSNNSNDHRIRALSTSGMDVVWGGNASASMQRWKNGDAVVFNEDSANQDFRVESDSDTHAFFVDAGASRVNMGTSGSLQSASTASNGWTWQGNYMVSCSNADTACILNRTSSVGSIAQFRYNGAGKGGIDISTSGTTYNTTSDIRLKTDINPIADATDKLMAMNPVSHRWKADPDADAVHGFIAQEMKEIVPEAVGGEDGGEEMMSMDYGRITPVLVAALQEAISKIETLENQVSNLTTKLTALKGN